MFTVQNLENIEKCKEENKNQEKCIWCPFPTIGTCSGLFPFADTILLGLYLLPKTYVHFPSFLTCSLILIVFPQYNYF